MPHQNTYRRIIAHVVAPAELDRVVSEHLQHLPGVGQSVVIAFDGKTVRGTIDAAHPQGVHLLAASLPNEGIVLLQVAAGGKENEISVAPTLLCRLDLRGKAAVVSCGRPHGAWQSRAPRLPKRFDGWRKATGASRPAGSP